MKYKRESPFRYIFKEPLSALFKINKIDGKLVKSSQGKAKIIDISPEGTRLNIDLNIRETDVKSIELSISFELNGKNLNFNGVIVWHKVKLTTNEYGVEFLLDEDEQVSLVKQLKVYSKKSIEEGR